MRWVALPLFAAVVLGWSGFLDRLDAMTVASRELATASEEAPKATQQAAEEVAPLPQVAHLTTIQADTFHALENALELSAQRVFRLNETLDEQADGIGPVVEGIRSIEDVLGCVRGRLRGLLGSARKVPGRVDAIAATLGEVEKIQQKSIRHLKSINRKLTALGAAAEATDVKPPPAPDIPDIDLPQEEADSLDC